jgi:hypothetical protein
MRGKGARALRAAFTPCGRAGTGEMFATMLLAVAATCAIELLAYATPWSRLQYPVVAWWLSCTAIRRANDIGRTWRFPAAILALTTIGLGTTAYGLIMAAFGRNADGYLLIGAIPLVTAVVLGGMLLFGQTRDGKPMDKRK